jgi:hypothetical protein
MTSHRLSSIAHVLLAAISVSACSLEKEVSRVAVPDTNITLVLTEDEKQMFRYHLLVDGKPAGEPGFLGPHDIDVSHKPMTAVEGPLVTFTWRGPLITQLVAFDVAACQMRDSRGGAPQKLPGCTSSKERKQL